MNKYLRLCVLLLAALLLVAGCVYVKQEEEKKSLTAGQVKERYLANIGQLLQQVEALQAAVAGDEREEKIQEAFYRARLAYKKSEFLTEAFHGDVAAGMNGAALQEVNPEAPGVIIEPEGFQVIEELLFPRYDKKNKEESLRQIRILATNAEKLKKEAGSTELSDSYIFDALRLQVWRIISLGLAGFDSPVALHSLPEAQAALEGISETLGIYAPALREKQPQLLAQLEDIQQKAINYLKNSSDFNKFDRLAFTTDHANVLSATLLQAQQALNIAVLTEERAIPASAPTLFEGFNPQFFAPRESPGYSLERVALGRMLFFDPALSGNNQRACASCHNPQKAFTDGMAKSIAFDFKGVADRNAPTVINAGLQAAQFHDGRVASLEEQIAAVLSNPTEMHSSAEEAAAKLSELPQYQILFREAFESKRA